MDRFRARAGPVREPGGRRAGPPLSLVVSKRCRRLVCSVPEFPAAVVGESHPEKTEREPGGSPDDRTHGGCLSWPENPKPV